MSTFIVNYINPIGLDNIGWRYYVITTVFIVLVLVIIYFTFVETKGLSLEEVATRKCSLLLLLLESRSGRFLADE